MMLKHITETIFISLISIINLVGGHYVTEAYAIPFYQVKDLIVSRPQKQ